MGEREAICVCKHARIEHYAERGECLFSTEDEMWACGCHEFVERDDWLDWEDSDD